MTRTTNNFFLFLFSQLKKRNEKQISAENIEKYYFDAHSLNTQNI